MTGQGTEAKFERMYEAHHKQVLAYCFRRSPGEGWDVAADTFAVACVVGRPHLSDARYDYAFRLRTRSLCRSSSRTATRPARPVNTASAVAIGTMSRDGFNRTALAAVAKMSWIWAVIILMVRHDVPDFHRV